MRITQAARQVSAVGVLTVVAALLMPSLALAKAPPLPSLLAHALNPATRKVEAKRLRLALLDPRAFRVVRRPSSSSVTLGWPSAKPCAFTTFHLSILPSASDADAAARVAVPAAEGEGTAAWQGGRSADGTHPTFRGAWRVHSELPGGDRLRVWAVATSPFVDSYSQPVGGLVQLRAQSRTVPNTHCSGPNQFSIGPNVINTIQLAAST